MAVLLIALLLGGYFRTIALFDWDEPSFRLHPDERFMIMVAGDIQLPSSFDEYLDSSINTLNPRNRGRPFYVYGMLPQLLTRYTAVALTPNDMLPPTVPYPRPTSDANNIPQVTNPELGYPKIPLLGPLLNPRQISMTDFYSIYKIGRGYAALFDMGSILLTFLIAQRLYGRRVAALAALLYALAALPIQLSHFFAVDPAAGFFVLLTVYCAVRIAQDGGPGSYVGLGLSIGAAMACRVTLATLGLIGVVAVVQRVWLNQGFRVQGSGFRSATDDRSLTTDELKTQNSKLKTSPLLHLGLLALAGLLSVLTFRVLQPDAFIGTSFFDLRPEPRFIGNIAEIGKYVSGELESPPSHQWANRTPYLFPLVNMVVWGMGLPFGLAAWGGWLAAGWQMLRRRALAHLTPWLSIALYFAWQGGILNPSMRYFVVLYGLFAMFAAWALVAIWDRRRPTTDDRRPTAETARWRSTVSSPWSVVRSRWSVVRGPWSALGRALLIFVVLGTLCWAYAFTRIYTQSHSRIAASRWIYANIPAGATISAESWDDPLPLNLDGRSSSQYVGVETYPYAEDDPTKYIGPPSTDGTPSNSLIDQLDRLDYIILSSNRVYGSISRLPMRFPALMRYYHYLFSGELGFEQVADIHSYPTLFGIPIPDQGAEEAFSVYDHPRVLIFKKGPNYSRQRAEQLITGDVAWAEVYKLPVIRASRMPTALRLTEAQWPSFRDGGTWANLFNPTGLTNKLPWLFWLLALELLGLAIFPLLFRLLPGLPDRGFALAKTLGLLLVAYGAWLLGSLGLMSFTPGSLWLCAAALIALGFLIARRNQAELLAFLRERRRALLAAEGLFLVAFFGFLLLRAINPDLWHPARGGEKPMDLAFLTAVLKSASFPPYDPWFAGGYLNYYYFGFVLVGALVHLTGVVPTVAYNLAVPTMFALTALGAWGAAYNLIASRSQESGVRSQKSEARLTRSPAHPLTPAVGGPWSVVRGRTERRAIVTGIVAAVLVVLVGSLANAFWVLPGSATPLDPREPPECQLSSYAAKERCKGRDEWVFWDATRLISLSLSTPENNDSTITEFPYFTFLYGDLHAHMIALPLALAALGLMVALIRTKNGHPQGQPRTGWRYFGSWFLVLGSLGLVVGALRATNTWDYPAYLGLSVVTLALLAWDRRRRGASWASAAGGWVLAALGLFLLSNLLFLPFTRNFATDYAGFTLWRGTHTLVRDYLKLHGLWLFLLCSAAVALYHRIFGIRPWQVALIAAAAIFTIAAAVQNTIALALLVPLAGLSVGLGIELLVGRRPTTDDGRRTTDDDESVVSGQWLVAENDDRHLTADDGQKTTDATEAVVSGQLSVAENDEALTTDDRRPMIDDAESVVGGQWSVVSGRSSATSLTTLLPAVWAVSAIWLTLLLELIVAKGDIGRMNTVFKLGMQSWVLFAVSSAIALTWLWGLTARRPTTDDRRPTTSRQANLQSPISNLQSLASRLPAWLWRGAAVLLVAAALVYPATATPVRLADRYDADVGITLDGAAYMRSAKAGWAENGKSFTFAEDADAIDWLRANVRGTPIVLEAHTEAYRWGGRISIYTGLPTLLGWPGHERQQRAVAQVDTALANRQALVSQLYTTTSPSETIQLLRLYGIEYIYIGQLERALYGDQGGLDKFDAMFADGQLQRVYSRGGTSIYQILPADHPPALLTTSLSVEPPTLPEQKRQLLDVSVEQLPAVNDYAWNRLAESQPVAVLLWLLACYALLLLGLPVSMLVFGRGLRPAAAVATDDIDASQNLSGGGQEISPISEASTSPPDRFGADDKVDDAAPVTQKLSDDDALAPASTSSAASPDRFDAGDAVPVTQKLSNDDEVVSAISTSSVASPDRFGADDRDTSQSPISNLQSPIPDRFGTGHDDDHNSREIAQPQITHSQSPISNLQSPPMLGSMGYLWARLIGLLLLGYAVWLPVSARLWRYDRLGLLLGVLIVLALNVVVLAWIGRDAEQHQEANGETLARSPAHPFTRSFTAGLRLLRDNLLAQRRQILIVEGLFLGAFAFMTVLRMLDPDLWQPTWGGEKPFEFGFLNAILRSPVMPPYDPFFSGGTINYYYYGLFLASLPIKATGIDPAVGYNLFLPTLYAITVTGAFALVVRLTGRIRYGLAGAAMLALLGNLAAAFQVGDSRGLGPVLAVLQSGGLSDFGARIGDWFWGPSRVIMISNQLTTINEFPYWSFLFADLHPHLIALPITLLLIAIAYELFDGRSQESGVRSQESTYDPGFLSAHPLTRSPAHPLTSVVVAQCLLAAFTLGALAVANSWDLPTYALLLCGALLGRAWRGRGRTTDDRRRTTDDGQEVGDSPSSILHPPSSIWFRLVGALLATGLIVAGALLLYLPFFQNFDAQVGGVGRVRAGTPLPLYVLVYGLFLAVLIPMIFAGVWRLLRHQEELARGVFRGHPAEATDAQVMGIVARAPADTALWRRLRRVLLIVPLLLAITLMQPVLSLKLWLGALIMLGLALLLSRRIRPAVWFTIWMAVVAWAVSLGIELIYIRDHLDGGDAERMNTVFKFGFQIWVLLALASAAALPQIARWQRRLGPLAQSAGGVVLAALIALSLVFPLVGTPSRLANRFPISPGPTLDGLAFMETAEFDVSAGYMGLPESGFPIHISLRGDAAATRWLNRTIEGTPIVLQSDLWFYRPYGVRIAANTGLPTIVSPLHASEQHNPGQVAERDQDVQTIYRTIDVDQALQLLSKYRVGYVYVGQIERAAYGEGGVAKFDQMVGSYLNTVYDSDGVKIYQVNESVYSITPPVAGTPSLPVVAPQFPQAPPAAPPPEEQASLETLEAQVQLNPTVSSLAFGLGQRYYALGRYDDAISVLDRAAVANPSDVPLHQLLGDVLRDVGRNDEAAVAYRAAAEAAPSAGNYNKLGLHLLGMGELDQAIGAFEQAIGADPAVPDPYYHLGQIYEQQGQPAQALERYQQYLQIAPPDGPLRPDANEAITRLQ